MSGRIRFAREELRDIGAAWGLLSLAFTFFIVRTSRYAILPDPTSVPIGYLASVFVASLLTVGVGFLLHELAHKVVAVRFGQIAAFRADYGMLGLAVLGGLAGFLFAAPGAVYHRGRITPREHGLIALAGPVVNVALAAAFVPLWLVGGPVGEAGQLGVVVNAVLAGFNMLPFGPLDGATVRAWSTLVFAIAFVICVGTGLLAYLFVGFPF
ncbi:metalloprotease [Halosegnis sp.]|uniref:metalloprotease n=1 Tax=Halosegnis sp. TaxID=2864959 RepID=UPI0035D4656D